MHLGIDFGTSYTKIAACETGMAVNLLPETGMIPTVASFAPSTGKLYFGDLALRLYEPGVETALFFKLALKRNPDMLLGPYSLPGILEKYFNYIRSAVTPSEKVQASSLTLTVPNYFGMDARRTLMDAAQKAFQVDLVQLIPEPVAAALGSLDIIPEQDKSKLEGDILVIDIGGGTTDFSFLTLDGGYSRVVLETQLQMGHDSFSGSEIDRGVIRYILDPLYAIESIQHLPENLLEEKCLSPRDRHLLNSLLRLAENMKITVGEQTSSYFHVTDLPGAVSLSFTLEAEFFTAALQPVFDRLRHYVRHTVACQAEQLGLYHNGQWSLSSILLLGGASKVRGLLPLVEHLFPEVTIIIPPNPDYVVAKGACCWQPHRSAFHSRVQTLYPFHFYVERLDHSGTSLLEKIPFDTANLEVDTRGRYKIFSFNPDSPYNIHCDPGGLELKVYEVSDDNPLPQVERFGGQELVLHVCAPPMQWPQQLDVYWDLANSCLELDYPGCRREKTGSAGYFTGWLEKQNEAFNLLDQYKSYHPGLREDFFDHLRQLERNTQKPCEDHLATTRYKLLSLLQIISAK